jgi:hypothetical protein
MWKTIPFWSGSRLPHVGGLAVAWCWTSIKPEEGMMTDSYEINENGKSIVTVQKERVGEVDLSAYGETDIERLMYEALQDYAYHKRCAGKMTNEFARLHEHKDPRWKTAQQHLEYHREKVEQARDRIRRYAKRLSPS